MSGDENKLNNYFSDDPEEKGSMPDYTCSVYCSSGKPKTSALHWDLDYCLS